MAVNFAHRWSDQTGHKRIIFLILCWITGLSIGIVLTSVIPLSHSLIQQAVISDSTSFFALLVASGISLAVCVIGVYYDSFLAHGCIVLIESVCRGFCGFAIYKCIGEGAWALRLLLFFSASVRAIVVWWLLLRFYTCGKSAMRNAFPAAAIIMFLSIMVDLLLVSPFIFRLSMYI